MLCTVHGTETEAGVVEMHLVVQVVCATAKCTGLGLVPRHDSNERKRSETGLRQSLSLGQYQA
jgi:hypothetical protein